MRNEAPPVRIFKKMDEKLGLLLSIFFILSSLVDAFLRLDTLSNFDTRLINLTKNVVFFLEVHFGFTIAFLISFPEFRVFDDRQKNKNLFYYSMIALVFLPSLFIQEYFSFQSGYGMFINNSMLLLIFYLSSFHLIWQVRGLNLIYLKKIETTINGVNSPSILRLKNLEKIEKSLFYVILWSFTACALSLSSYSKLLLLEGSPELFKVSLFILILSIFSIIFSQLLAPKKLVANKIIFLLRLILLPLFFFSPLAVFSLGALHGIEYLFLFRKLSKTSQRKRTKIDWPAILPCISIAILGLPANLILEKTMFHSIFYSAMWTLAFWHFFVDRQIFRMRDPNIRKNVGALLLRD